MRVLAFDQSYARTGVALSENGRLTWVAQVSMKGSNTEKRKTVRRVVKRLIKIYAPDFVTVERIRLFSGGNVSAKVVMSLGALNLSIVDAADPVCVYSIDTRSWKSKVIGSAKATKDDAVSFIRGLGVKVKNHDQADAACMALYACRMDALLKQEK